jgi:hypothetical protein
LAHPSDSYITMFSLLSAMQARNKMLLPGNKGWGHAFKHLSGACLRYSTSQLSTIELF